MNFKNLLKDELLSGRTVFDWAFMCFGLILQSIGIWYGFHTGNPDSIGLIISGIAGVVSVVLCSQGKISFYIFGFIQLFTYVFCFSIPQRLHGETLENGMYFITMIYGLYVWFKNYKRDTKTESIEVKSKNLTWKGWIISLTVFAVGTIIYWQILKNFRMPWSAELDSQPLLDAVTSVPAYIAQIFMILGNSASWFYWAILDIFSVVLAWRAGSYVMVAQFIFWTLNTFYGFYKWYKSAKYENYVKIE